MIKSVFQVLVISGIVGIASPSLAFQAAFVTKNKCASENGQQLAVIFSDEGASPLISEGYLRNTVKCVKQGVPTSVDDDGCTQYEVTGEIRSASVRLGTLEYALVDSRTGALQTLSKGAITGWLSARHNYSSGLDWSDVKWSFDENGKLATLILLPKGPYSENPTTLSGWIFDNQGKKSDSSITEFLKTNSFALENTSSGESTVGLSKEVSAQLLSDMFDGQKEINVYVENCGQVVTGYRK